MTTVVIVDDHLLLAESVAATLSADPELDVVGIATTGAEGLNAVAAEHPDVCLLDQRLPDGLGTDLVPALLSASPETSILLVTASNDDEVLRRALSAGCVGFLTKGEGAATLLEAVRRAAAGEVVLTAGDLRRLVPSTSTRGFHLGSDLTDREREVLALLCRGTSTENIASSLYVSPSTARNHIQSILNKLSAHSRLEAVTIAIREGLVPSPN